MDGLNYLIIGKNSVKNIDHYGYCGDNEELLEKIKGGCRYIMMNDYGHIDNGFVIFLRKNMKVELNIMVRPSYKLEELVIYKYFDNIIEYGET